MRVFPYLICALASAVAVSACGSEASCPSGSVKNKKGVCEKKGTPDGGTSSDGDPATDGESDASTEGDGCTKAETCNGVDDDCDGKVDEDLTGDSFIDKDKDGYGTGDPVAGCRGVGYASKNGDCDDGDDSRSPGASEVCNGADDNCDGTIDEGVRVTLYLDEDGDGHGLASDSDVYCAGQVVPNRVPSNADCDDKCPTCSPDNTQETLCDGKDDDCDGEIDEGVDQLFEADCDRDKFASSNAQAVRSCATPALAPDACKSAIGAWIAASDSNDCDDANVNAYPGAIEVCDNRDNDCNNIIDEAAGSQVSKSLHRSFRFDGDGDKYGVLGGQELVQCNSPGAGWVPSDSLFGVDDCADGDWRAYPNSPHEREVIVAGTNNWDYNCDGASTTVEPWCGSGQKPCDSGPCWEGPAFCGSAVHRVCKGTKDSDGTITWFNDKITEAPPCN